MKIVVVADVEMQKEFEEKSIPEGMEVHFETSITGTSQADAFFYLLQEDHLKNDIEVIRQINSPVFVNAVITTLTHLPENVIRINGWSGFIQRLIVEICAAEQNKESAKNILDTLEWKYQIVPDMEGMISAKVISMIVNEAYFALGDDVSSKEDIDTAMKLGTNYPYGPFEWSKKIGLKNIYNLLTALSKKDERYQPAPSLLNDIPS